MIAFAFTVSAAFAWESECRPESAAGDYGGRNSDPAASICANVWDAPTCEPGIDSARGALLGEHTSITRQAMAVAGLYEARTTTFLDYWGSNVNVLLPGGGSSTSWAPAHTLRMVQRVQRPTVLPELAQVPDVSHTFGDWLLGNEHCTVPNLPKGDPAKNQACHSLNPHMGAVNSTHFLPQAEVMYRRYHFAALEVAERCKAMADAAEASDHILKSDVLTPAIAECQSEALALESVASHYLADAWSTGHMWQRWGSPHAPSDPRSRMNLSAVAITSGMIHGWRSVVRDKIGDNTDVRHDALCMPGTLDSDDTAPAWRVIGEDTVQPGGGDLYLLQCNARGRDVNGAVATAPALAPQFARMRACMAAGFAEVYDAGPRTWGDRSPPANPEPAITSSQDVKCWNQRVTNAAFLTGMGLSDKATLANPGFVTRMVLKVVLGNQASGLADLGVTEADVRRTRRQLRAELAKMGTYAAMRAAADPQGTDLAELRGPMRQLLGFMANGDYIHPTRNDFRPAAAYLEPLFPDQWSDPLYSAQTCTTDADCEAVYPFGGYYCDRTQGSGACTPTAAPIRRAFRRGELPYYCGAISDSALDDIRQNCVDGISTGACDACVDMVLPHLRNACDRPSWDLLNDEDPSVDRRSVCDVLSEADVGLSAELAPVYALHDGTAAGARAAARTICETDPKTRPNRPTDWYWTPEVSPVSIELDTDQPMEAVAVKSTEAGPPLDWTVDVMGSGVTASPATFTSDGGVDTSVTFTASALSPSRAASSRAARATLGA